MYSYADDNTHYVVKSNIGSVIKSMENSSVELFEWFSDKCQSRQMPFYKK